MESRASSLSRSHRFTLGARRLGALFIIVACLARPTLVVASAGYFLAPFHPWSTGLFMLAAAYGVLGAIVSNPMNACRGTLVLGAGVPVYLWWKRAQVRHDTAGRSGA